MSKTPDDSRGTALFLKAIRQIAVAGALLFTQIACQATTYTPDRVDFLFSEEQRSIYEQYLRESTKDDFGLSIRIGTDQEPVSGTAHLRGQSSFSCERRNYTLNLYGNRPHNALPSSASDEFFLLSLCKDDRHIRQHTVLQLWRQLGLFPFDFRYVELTIDGESRGVYLLVEKLDRLRIASDRLRAIMRREAKRGKTTVEVKYSATEPQATRAAYDGFLGHMEGLSGADLMAAFRDRMDLDQYLLWVATNTLLRNGDSIDELWLLATERIDSQGVLRDYYHFAGWDPEDIFTLCHFGGPTAFVDPHELVYCAEADWDHTLLSDPYIYSTYVDILEDLASNRLTDTVFQSACDRTEAELSRLLSRPGVAAAMVELLAVNPRVADPAVAQQAIRGALQRLAFRFSKERATMLEQIVAYRKAVASEPSH
jgi:hypothetical protein